jgi:WD40 repeat protein
MSKRKNNNNDNDLSAFLPSLGKKTKLNENELPTGFGKIQQNNNNNNYDYAIDQTLKKKVEVKEKSKQLGPEAPDKIYIYGQDDLPETKIENKEIKMSEIDEDVFDDNPYDIPCTHEVELKGHDGHVAAMAIDPSGSRLISGGYDSVIKFWDFNAMDANFKSFRTIEPETDVITQLDYSPTGDRFIMGSNSTQARVFTRDGKEIALLPKGYPYITDMAATKGHIAKITTAIFHPTEKDIVITSSLDCTVRLWDLENIKKHKDIIKLRNAQGAVKSGVSVCNIDPTGATIGVVCIDGSLQFFNSKGPFNRAVIRNDNAHQFGSETSSIIFSKDGNTVITRGGDDTMKCWDKRKLNAPTAIFEDLPNKYQETDCIFSPDESLICTGTSLAKGVDVGKVSFFDKQSLTFVREVSVTDNSVISLIWHPVLNQIMCGCTDKNIHVLYNPELSQKGVMYCVKKHPKRYNHQDFVAIQNIQTPHALPMFRQQKNTKRQRDKAKSDPTRASIPVAPQIGPGVGGRLGSSLTASIMKGLVQKTNIDNDPRAALLKYHDEKGLKEMSDAYKHTQPVPIFQPIQEDNEDGQ